jgi:hypothetical protein
MMNDKTDTTEAPPKHSYLDTQLSEAITPPSEREKLRQSFDAFCEEIDQAEASLSL